MLDHLLDVDDYPECSECGAELILDGDLEYEGSYTCCNEDCDYEEHWDRLP
jgi:hypothetical protein